MNVKQLREILDEYPPSMKLKIIAPPNPKASWEVGGETVLETTVLETVLKLMQHPDETLMIFDCADCIVRERGEEGRSPPKHWLELDLR